MTVMLPQHLPRRLSRRARPTSDGRRHTLEATTGSGRPVRRVRHEVRDGVAVVAFSAAASTALAMMLLLLARVAG